MEDGSLDESSCLFDSFRFPLYIKNLLIVFRAHPNNIPSVLQLLVSFNLASISTEDDTTVVQYKQPDEQRDETIQEVHQSFCKPEPESAIDIDQSASSCPDNSSMDSNIIARWPLPSGLEKEDVKGVDVQGNVSIAQPSG
ncbi:uncharacterized protein LOC120415474 isoform X2 [Culex pipiens pallens]|uniref:uncharacterized protein LOC120415474 isoform X2 n=1 Tax=Culex pipiens pallens TaxID=42434 RepID=UPI001954A7BE|nr:uncharacterized protein LOC120415474 isoform X2 [Culex pipiens pallens]